MVYRLIDVDDRQDYDVSHTTTLEMYMCGRGSQKDDGAAVSSDTAAMHPDHFAVPTI
jgi:hypothetical protein